MSTPAFIRANAISINRSFNSVGVVTSTTYITKDNEVQVDLYPYGVGFIPPKGFTFPSVVTTTPVAPVSSLNLPLRLREYPVKVENTFNEFKQLISTKTTYADATVFYDVFTYPNSVDVDFSVAQYGVAPANLPPTVSNKIVYGLLSAGVSVSSNLTVGIPNVTGRGAVSTAISAVEFFELNCLIDGLLAGEVSVFLSTIPTIRPLPTSSDLIFGMSVHGNNLAGFVAANATTGATSAFASTLVPTQSIVSVKKALNGLDLAVSYRTSTGTTVMIATVPNVLSGVGTLYVTLVKKNTHDLNGVELAATVVHSIQVKLK